MRHAVELFLKAASADLLKLAEIRKAKTASFDFAGSHDLDRIWDFVRHHAVALDARFQPLIRELASYIIDIASIDPNGQVFRYPFDKENRKHLTEVSIINVLVLKQRFNSAEQLLHGLRRTHVDLLEEYAWGTFTQHLSRHQIVQLALDLPPRSAWGEAGFTETKLALKSKYSLSSRELGEALNKIQERHEMAALIGLQVDVPGLSLDTLQAFLDAWTHVNDLHYVKEPPEPSLVTAAEFDLQEVLRRDTARKQSADALAQIVSPQAFATLRALDAFQREPALSEAFDRLLLSYEKEVKFYEDDPGRFRQSLGNLLLKPLAMEHVLNSLNFLGQQRQLASLIQRYELAAYSDRLLKCSEDAKARLRNP